MIKTLTVNQHYSLQNEMQQISNMDIFSSKFLFYYLLNSKQKMFQNN